MNIDAKVVLMPNDLSRTECLDLLQWPASHWTDSELAAEVRRRYIMGELDGQLIINTWEDAA